MDRREPPAGATRGVALLRRAAVTGSLPRMLVSAAVVVAVVVIGVLHRSTVDAGSESLAAADTEWLILAGLATAALWIVGTVTQLGSMPIRPPFGRLLAVQAAASFANHLLPAGAGGLGINIRFLRRHGLDAAAAAGATGLNALAGMATHVALLIAAIAISPRLAGQVKAPANWHRPAAPEPGILLWAGIGVALALFAAVLVLRRTGWLRQLPARLAAARARIAGELRRLGAVLRDPYRAAALWIGSLSTPLLHALILFAVLHSLAIPLPLWTVVVVYVVVSAVSAVIPSPGGIGALDVTLLAGLVAVGVAPTAALATVLGYRMITVWLPFLPGALVLTVLVRRRII